MKGGNWAWLLKSQTPSDDPPLPLRGSIYVLQNEVNELHLLSLSKKKREMRILIVPHATRHRLCSFFLCLHLRYKSWESSEFQRMSRWQVPRWQDVKWRGTGSWHISRASDRLRSSGSSKCNGHAPDTLPFVHLPGKPAQVCYSER